MEFLRNFDIERSTRPPQPNETAQRDKEYLQNLRTYSFQNWLHKPQLLSPNICSVYGWRCSKENMLSCRKCQAALLVKLPSDHSTDYNIQVTKYYEMLSTKHESTCSYRESPLPHDLIFLPKMDPKQYLESVISDFMVGKHEKLTVFFHSQFEDRMEEFDSLVDWLIRKAHTEGATKNYRKLMLLVLSGWKVRPKQKLECANCFRLIGFWNYHCDIEPEPKRLSAEEWNLQKMDFIREFTRTDEGVPVEEALKGSLEEKTGNLENVVGAEEIGVTGEKDVDVSVSTKDQSDQSKTADKKNPESDGESGIGETGGDVPMIKASPKDRSNPSEIADKENPERENKSRIAGEMDLDVSMSEAPSRQSAAVGSTAKNTTSDPSGERSAIVKRSLEESSKRDLHPLKEHYPWCRWIFTGLDYESEESQPGWLQRIECLNELKKREELPRRQTKLVSVGAMLDAALNPVEG